ncbi:hypothetical protein OCU04_009917 [Sclerotinia nivalis]|uniref:Uncharacterized protein n=1 Tax=Sclerotinia nivalis TaxID=352851 RepID=A0A9X0AEQ8_9HELO|nr:hypothetical protein OCU04_009917 [Sclerotinia nivalis]
MSLTEILTGLNAHGASVVQLLQTVDSSPSTFLIIKLSDFGNSILRRSLLSGEILTVDELLSALAILKPKDLAIALRYALRKQARANSGSYWLI